MNHLTIITESYSHNAAASIRLISLLRAFDKTEVNIDLFFLRPTKSYDTISEHFNHITCHYLWSNKDNTIFRRLHTFWNRYWLRKNIQGGDTVYLYGVAEMVPVLAGRKDIRVFHERSEHPDVVPFPRLTSKRNYYKGCRKIAGLFVISTALREHFAEMGVPRDNIHITNMIVDARRFDGLQKETVKQPYIAYCGTASNNKDGVDRLIKAFARVAAKVENIQLYIMGKTPSSSDKAGNYALVEQLRIKERVKFLGVIPSEQMPQMLKNAEIVALARPDSLQARCGFASKIGEYLLSETPVVVTNVGDFPLFLTDGDTALLCEPGDDKQFSDKMLWALEHKEEAKEIGFKGKQVALRCFNNEIEVSKILKVLF